MTMTYNSLPFEVTVQLKNGEIIVGRCISNPIKLRGVTDDAWLSMCTRGSPKTPGPAYIQYETIVRFSEIVTIKVREVKLQ